MSSPNVVIATLIVYMLGLLLAGYWASARVKTEGDFFIASGGGGLGPWVAGLSYAASTSSAWVLLGYTGFVFSAGVKALWLIPGIFGGYVMTWLVMGPKLRRETAEKGHITMVDFMAADTHGPWRGRIAALAAALIIFCFVFYVASQFQAAGNAFVTIFGLSMAQSIVLGAVIIVAYCLMGGFLAASITDAFQAVVMLAACVIVPIATVSAAGGMDAALETLRAQEAATYFAPAAGAAGLAAAGIALGLIGTGLGALGQPQLLNRIMAVKSRRARMTGAAITIGWGAVIYVGVTALALSMRALLPQTAPEEIFFVAAQTYLPPVIAGIVFAALLSAVMSTVDSLLLAAASAISHDLGAARFMPGRELLAGRLAMVAVAALATVLTLTMPASIFDRVLFSWVALGAAFGPLTLTRCLGVRTGGAFAFFAILAGFAIAVTASIYDGPLAAMCEKWLSWAVGLVIIFAGRIRSDA